MESTSSAVTMCATVLRVCPCELCVCDHENCQQVLVHTDNACCFRVGPAGLHRVQRRHDPELSAPDHRRLCPAGELLLLNI